MLSKKEQLFEGERCRQSLFHFLKYAKIQEPGELSLEYEMWSHLVDFYHHLESEKVIDRYASNHLSWYYGFCRCEFYRDADIFYIIPINYIVRYWLRLYWGFLRAFYWVGVIDTNIAECFRWDDFWRIGRTL